MNKKYISVALGAVTGIAMIVPAFAQTGVPTTTNTQRMMRFGGGQKGEVRGPGTKQMINRPSVQGTVTGVSGNIITLSGHLGMASSTVAIASTTFTIDATNAKIIKNNATSTVTAIVAGDTLYVQGTVTGTNVVATMIRDGFVMGTRAGKGDRTNGNQNNGGALQQLQGNGQPIVAGTVSSISGTTLIITNKSNVTYTVDVTSSKILKNNATSTVTSVATGDMVIIQGAVNGTTITASTVIDNGAPKAMTAPQQALNQKQTPKGFFSGIGGFFSRMFGF
jgi:hypothetical protein